MKKEIRIVNSDKRILQVTTVDERWYIKDDTDKAGLPCYKYVPSVTWIAEYYPKGIGFYKWLSNKGWDEAEALKEAAADKGSKVHLAVADLISRKTVRIDSKYPNKEGVEEELSLEEYSCVMSFVKWVNDVKPIFHKNEFVIFNDEYDYAGTVDILCAIDSKLYLVDLKTSKYVWPSHILQVSAYKKSTEGNPNLAILQLGYTLNKAGYKFNEVEDRFDLFLSAKSIWYEENKNVVPKQKDYPLEIKL